MKYSLSLLILLLSHSLLSQSQRINPHQLNISGNENVLRNLVNDENYDVHFYHLDLEIGVSSPMVSGSVQCLFTSNIDGLTAINMDLDNAFIIDSISAPASSYNFENNELSIALSQTYDTDDIVSITIYYHGIPPLAGGYKGLRYEMHDGNEPVIASLSTPYLAHTWWPCKDGTSDKADSVYIDITIDDITIDGNPLMVVSNGMLEETIIEEGKRCYKWRHNYPIVPYYVMVAISNYHHFQQIIDDGEYTFPIDYYVFESHLTAAQAGVAEMPAVMAFFSEVFGPYPFREEKYGMTQLGYYGGIENQTNTIINNMGLGWFEVSVHEMAHMWFADMITCETWNHGWLNEGFATYAEALYAEHSGGFSAYQSNVSELEFYGGGTVYMADVSDPFNVFQSIIYNKGGYVLHMLRGVLGEEDFFEAIYQYASDDQIKYGLATTEYFQEICEAVSGDDLGYFFDQWIYDERYPKYNYDFAYSTNDNNLEIALLQVQDALGWREVFTMPVEIKIVFSDGTDSIVSVFNDMQNQIFNFNFDQEVSDIIIDPNKWILKNAEYDSSILVGVETLEFNDILIYPNPNKGAFSISASPSLVGQRVKLSITNMMGKLCYEDIFPSIKEFHKVNISEFKPGVYFLNIESEKGVLIRKLVME